MPLEREEELHMKWVTPKFEIIELSSEVTCYRYHR
jgi:coenzyme PQQ precursor peptide PqqA